MTGTAGSVGEAVGIDVGGTKTAAARVGGDGNVLALETLPTPADDVDATLATIVKAARAVMTPDVTGVGIAAAGLVEWGTGELVFAPNLAWRQVPLTRYLTAELGVPVVADNDNTAAAWGEYVFGAGRGFKDLLLVGVGTGIGGGIVSGGRLFHGAHGFAAEIGHIVMDPAGPFCGCGNRGCWEQLASGQAVTRAGRAAVQKGAETALVELTAGDQNRVTGPMVTHAARDGDAVSIAILADVGHWLGVGIGGLVNILDPEIVVMAGGVVEAGDLLLDPARAAYRETVEAAEMRPDVPLVMAAFGNHAGVVGAAALVLEAPG
ncbi:MAG: ROK family protein [Actinomycetota bacterium]